MDATEFNPYNSKPLRPDMFRLPEITELSMKVVPFTAPQFKHLKSHLEKYKQALEITIITNGPIPARGATPVLYINGTMVSHYTKGKKENEYRFYLFEWKRLKKESPIKWGWDNDLPEDIRETKFYYKPPSEKQP
jgi:hypothetical protein